MADEPTGALDSNTGKQVFEALQKLSKTKLVIIVSHDREYAEYYGDRVIEFSDGVIISDIKKYKAQSEAVSDGVSIIDDRILHVKKGHKLSAAEKNKVLGFLENTDEEIILSKDGKSNIDFRKQARIDENGNKESFEKSGPDNMTLKKYDPNQFKMIRSKLPLKHRIRIGASALKVKPIRLFFTILLSAIAFGLFGLADTLGAYDKLNTTYMSMQETGIKYAAFSKSTVYSYPDSNYTLYENVNMTDSDVSMLENKFTNYKFSKVYSFPGGSYGAYIQSIASGGSYSDKPYPTMFYGYTESNAQDVAALGYSLKGTYPVGFNEIAVSKIVYEAFKEFGYIAPGTSTKVEITSEDGGTTGALIGKKINVDGIEYTVTGIIDTQFDKTRYEALFSGTASQDNGVGDYILRSEVQTVLRYSHHALAFFAEGYGASTGAGIKIGANSINFPDTGDWSYAGEYVNNSLSAAHFITAGKTTLADNEVLLPARMFFSLVDFDGYDSAVRPLIEAKEADLRLAALTQKAASDASFVTATRSLLKQYYIVHWGMNNSGADAKIIDDETGLTTAEFLDNALQKLSYNYQNETSTLLGMDFWQWRQSFNGPAMFEVFLSSAGAGAKNLTIRVDHYTQFKNITTEFKVVGICSVGSSHGGDVSLFSSKTFNEVSGYTGDIAFVLTALSGKRASDMELIKFSYEENNGVMFGIQSAVSSSLGMVNSMIEALAKVFLYIGIGFAVFASLMLLNFIGTSIAYKKREIGILRAVGARSGDVFGIFFSESAIIALISFVVAFILSFVGCYFVNNAVRNQLGLPLTILNIGFRQGILLLGVSLGAAFLASVLPVYKIAMKKPIDAIRK